jgi:hypothetical protein
MQNIDHNIVFLKKRQFFAENIVKSRIFSAENWQKSQKIVIITSTPSS